MSRVCIVCNKERTKQYYDDLINNLKNNVDKDSFIDDEGFPLIGEWVYVSSNIVRVQNGAFYDDYDLKESIQKGHYCIDCFNKIPKEEHLHVNCHNCNKKFRVVFNIVAYEKHDQGEGCCSIVNEKEIICSYGSKHDCTIFAWKSEPKNIQNICDECIDEFLKEGIIEVDRYY